MTNHLVNIFNKTKIKLNKNQLIRIIKDVLEILKIKKSCEINLILVDDKFITKLNRTYRGVNSPTDILTFGLLEKTKEKFDSPDQLLHLGDIFISLETAKRQSRKRNCSLILEITILLIHGILHIFGYEHKDRESRRRMERKTEKILEELGKQKTIHLKGELCVV